MLINIAVDSGFGYAMGKCALREVKISNYIRQIEPDDIKDVIKNINNLDENNILIKYDGAYYAVGKLAQRYDKKVKRYLTINRIGDIEHLIELLSVIGMCCDNSTFDANLMVALPEKMIKEADDFERWMAKRFEFSFITKEKEYKKIVNIKKTICINQGLAPIYNLSPADREKEILSIDIGHFTYNLCYWNAGQASPEYRLNGDGMYTCYDDLKKRLINRYYESEYKLAEVSDTELELAIETGFFKLKGQKLNIDDLLDLTFEKKAKELFKEIDRKYNDILPRVDMILANGGALQNENFTERFANKFKNYGVVFASFDESQWAVTRGMYKLLNELEEDDFNMEDIQEIAITDERVDDIEE